MSTERKLRSKEGIDPERSIWRRIRCLFGRSDTKGQRLHPFGAASSRVLRKATGDDRDGTGTSLAAGSSDLVMRQVADSKSNTDWGPASRPPLRSTSVADRSRDQATAAMTITDFPGMGIPLTWILTAFQADCRADGYRTSSLDDGFEATIKIRHGFLSRGAASTDYCIEVKDIERADGDGPVRVFVRTDFDAPRELVEDTPGCFLLHGEVLGPIPSDPKRGWVIQVLPCD
jgi:hypothetical protein